MMLLLFSQNPEKWLKGRLCTVDITDFFPKILEHRIVIVFKCHQEWIQPRYFLLFEKLTWDFQKSFRVAFTFFHHQLYQVQISWVNGICQGVPLGGALISVVLLFDEFESVVFVFLRLERDANLRLRISHLPDSSQNVIFGLHKNGVHSFLKLLHSRFWVFCQSNKRVIWVPDVLTNVVLFTKRNTLTLDFFHNFVNFSILKLVSEFVHTVWIEPFLWLPYLF